MYKFAFLFIPVLLLACSTDDPANSDDLDIDETFNELQDDIIGPVWDVKTDSQYFEIDVPTQMSYMEQLNPEAKVKYGYVEKIDEQVMENYVIVIVEGFPENEQMADKIDVAGFTEAYIDSLMEGKANYEILNEPAIESINGMEATVHELKAPIITANDSLINIYYMLGVYAGQKGLYQVLSWTLMDQKEMFRSDMRRMIYSFKEIGTETETVIEEEEEHNHEGHAH